MRKFFKKPKLLLFFFFAAILFTRFYNLDITARFTRDESSDLARMHQYYTNKQISLVGPISSEQDKVFSSLSYYLIMPFAAAFNFTPVSPVYGMAVFGVITAILLLVLINTVNKKYLFVGGSLLFIWYPLLTVSRWAWNPHFVVFWAALAILLYQYREKLGLKSLFTIGVSLGAMFHHHYVAIFTTLPFLLFVAYPYFKKKQYKELITLMFGYSLPYLLFILFDLKNPPGLFFGKYLTGGNTPHIESALSLSLIWQHLLRNISVYLKTFIPNVFLQIVFALSFITLFLSEYKSKKYSTLLWVVPGTVVIIGGIFLNEFHIRYVYSSILFIFTWLIIPKKSFISNFVSKFMVILLLIGSMFTIKSQLTSTDVPPSMRVITNASHQIINTIKDNSLNNANVAALSSSDDAPLAERYRDYIRMKGVGLREHSEYDVSEHLFVISTATDEKLREDKSFAMIAFKDKKLQNVFTIDDDWKVFWYGTD